MRPAFGVLVVVACAVLAPVAARAQDEEDPAAVDPAAPQDPTAVGPAEAEPPPESPTIINVSAAFRPGPYTTITLHPLDPGRVAIGTADGHVAWSEDAAASSDDALIIPPRKFDPVTIRSGARAEFSARGDQADIDRVLARHLSKVRQGRQDERSLLTFLTLLGQGLGAARFQAWMSITDPYTDIGDVAYPRGGGAMAAATQTGIYMSDSSRWSWVRTLGGPGAMPREGDIIGLAVAIDPNDPRRVLASTDRGVMISDNGGYTWAPHPDADLEEAWVTRIVWDALNPQLVFAVTPDSILLSQDSGLNFDPSFAADGDIKDLALSPEAAVVATSKGIQVATSEGIQSLIVEKDLIGAIPWRDSTYLAATADELLHVAADGKYEALIRTTPSDPYLRLVGDGKTAWLLSSHTVLRIGDTVPRGGKLVGDKPRMLLSSIAMEDAVIDYTGIGQPEDTQLHNRWYAKLLPRVTATFTGTIGCNNERFGYGCGDYPIRAGFYPGSYSCGQNYTVRDDTVLPFEPWQTGATTRGLFHYEVFASWELRELLTGDDNVSNPNLIIESQIRDKRAMLLEQVRWRYRECAALVRDLQRPPADPLVELNWRMRLEEYASYLEFMSGRKVVERTAIEKLEIRE